MLTNSLLNPTSFSTRNHRIQLRVFHGTWILFLHLALIYVLMATRQVSSTTDSQSEFKSLMQWVSLRVNQLKDSRQSTTQPRRLERVPSEASAELRSNSQSTSQEQENRQMSTQESSQVSSNKNIDLADPFTLPADIARLDTTQRRYGVQVPKQLEQETQVGLTPAQQAANDVRTNSPKLTKSELFARAAGNLECIYQARMANGKIIREPGRWIEVPARSEPGQPKNIFKARFCVRLHQNDDADGNDLTEISAGIRGK